MAGLTVIILPVGVNQYMISIRTYKSICIMHRSSTPVLYTKQNTTAIMCIIVYCKQNPALAYNV